MTSGKRQTKADLRELLAISEQKADSYLDMANRLRAEADQSLREVYDLREQVSKLEVDLRREYLHHCETADREHETSMENGRLHQTITQLQHAYDYIAAGNGSAHVQRRLDESIHVENATVRRFLKRIF